mgnify:CR=1 FL=1
MELYKDKFKKIHGYEEGKIDAIDKESSNKALDYKKNFLKKFISINQNQIDKRLGGEKYFVTKKYDGEYANIFFDNGIAVTVNRSGRTRMGITCVDEVQQILKDAGIKQAILPAEIYVYDENKRTRTNDLLTVLADKKQIGKLRLAVFDIIELDNKPYRPKNYSETCNKLNELFSKGTLVHPVEMETAASNEQVKEIYHKWVEEQGAEGLVVRSEMPFVYKIKPRHTIDTVVIGFTEGTGDQKGKVRTLLLAMMPKEGKYQVVSKIGGGFSEQQKAELFKKFSKMVIKSEYIDTDSNHIAFQMIKPEVVLEMNINDVIYETANGFVMNTLLTVDKKGYKINSLVEGVSFIAPIFERFRDDKKADADDVRLSQIESFSNAEYDETTEPQVINADLPKSEILLRKVYRKKTGNKVIVQKYLIWKTNKEQSVDYPAYVLHYSNYSTDRKDNLQRDVRISSDKKQLFEIQKNMLAENIKQGWEKVETEKVKS